MDENTTKQICRQNFITIEYIPISVSIFADIVLMFLPILDGLRREVMRHMQKITLWYFHMMNLWLVVT